MPWNGFLRICVYGYTCTEKRGEGAWLDVYRCVQVCVSVFICANMCVNMCKYVYKYRDKWVEIDLKICKNTEIYGLKICKNRAKYRSRRCGRQKNAPPWCKKCARFFVKKPPAARS